MRERCECRECRVLLAESFQSRDVYERELRTLGELRLAESGIRA